MTLFYASFLEDVTWQAFADFVSPTVEPSMMDVARHPDAALAEGVEIMQRRRGDRNAKPSVGWGCLWVD